MAEPIYIFSDGILKRKENTILLETKDGKRHIPVENVSEINIFSEVDLNKRLLEFLTEKQIIVHFFNHFGYYVGSYYPREFLNSGLVILKQAEHYLNSEKRLLLARMFVKGALCNIINTLKKYNDDDQFAERIQSIRNHVENLILCSEVNQLMALEGNAREIYYSCFDRMIKSEHFQFGSRTKRPPENELNALMSFANSLLYTTVLSQIYRTHLDPRIGYLHSTNNRRFTLNLDIAEIFKPVLVDRMILTLVNRKQIKPTDFHQIAGGISMKESAKKLLVQTFEERLQDTIHHAKLKRQVSYRSLIRMEAYKIEKHILEDEEYEPYLG
ncbi:MAG: CRISPR-associated endonuclease Cas1 [Thermotoga sp. 50_1627]|uniref:CRISPR-associated endonuclease Cas1 n=1 Tax=Pseudothermotoga hypogea DSM 11164 = NBRC 106472 TaxID=1123384 RepID=A0A0X1KRI4_9THEM|nr:MULTISPECIES: type I-B CRISPR-associated endonuclease Cas1b [Pseudothermotoga]AJC73784.1 CRISPR-associated protein Cas1 [Pseudothermotoga hypogea DSM 11164 = NBRC 106472]KUK23931.1 MAG: CRISPR-associated endonuclease Cas1 [Thermotoga sp. 50_1627]MBC7123118.1 type I-B CRISPR-associated endonuclease Cas1 [Pseudothermotoga sp.]MDI6862404.1 type I-B CRISPR-associated endonuclease Cas1b [Pseudothermotoga sp.]